MEEHGSFELELTGNTIIFRAYDAWNQEIAIRWAAEVKTMVRQICHEPWTCLVDLTRWDLSTPDVREHVIELNLWLDEHNLSKIAYVFGFATQESLLSRANNVFKHATVKHFFCLEEGKAWLELSSDQ